MGGGADDAFTPALGRCDEMRAEVFLRPRIASIGHGAPCTIAGTLSGPQRGRDTTLPATARLEPTGAGGVARAILTEPAYWTPDLPNLYRLRVTIGTTGAPPRAIDRLVGLRRIGVRGRSLWLDGRRWVPRGCRVDDVDGLAACKAAALAAVVTEPDHDLLARADEIGVAVIALISAAAPAPASVVDRVATWSAHPSALLAILPPNIPAATAAEITARACPLKDTLLLAATAPSDQPPPAAIPAGIDALVVALVDDAPPHDAWRGGAPVPLLAGRSEDMPRGSGRAHCDALQAALATWGIAGRRDPLAWDWAGYVVASLGCP